MKKILFAAAAMVAFTSVAQASDSLSGAYAGVRFGHTGIQVKDKTASTNTIQFGAESLNADIVAGYGQVMDSFYLGGELTVGMDSGNHKLQQGVINYKSKLQYGGNLRLGYLITQKSMVYLSLGLASHKNQYEFLGTNGTFVSSKQDLAFVPGVGAEIALADNVSFRTDFNYVMGKDRTVAASSLAAIGVPAADQTLKTTKAKFTVGLVFKF